MLQHELAQAMLRDRHRLRSALARALDAQRSGRDVRADLDRIGAEIAASVERAKRRREAMPRVRYPEELPVSERKDEIAAAIAARQVVIVAGETGSGKTTQLPKICMQLGRGVEGMIAHTQPRRIAARTVAGRIAQEIGTPLGKDVGFRVRFSDRVGEDNYLRVMTDGILLAETQTDRFLNAYDTIIIDEAHERSLNIDFLLGYVKRLLPKRPELKLIITSATIDAERFARHFDDAPVIQVSGRLYPVEIRYHAFDTQDEDEQDIDLPDAIAEAVDDVTRLSVTGDVLVFLPGEREIRETAEALRKRPGQHAEILPLFARLSAQEQEQVFQPGNARRIVLATNVAETSLTVPGIKYVIDSGLARVNRYSYRNKHEMLQIEKISRASANQRAGRCGRVMSGVCVRLYAEEDFATRPEFTDPEILRASLASVILRMKALRLGEVEDFPFVEPPSARAIADGYSLLLELGAVDEQRRLTEIGKRLADLPIDPSIGRMVVAAREENCLTEMLVIASGLAIPDPRNRPMEKAESADAAHAKFANDRSEFLGLVELWKFFDDALKHKKSNRKLAQLCQENFLSYVRMREWRDLHGQLHAQVSELGWRFNETPATYDQLHRAVLAGLLGNIGAKSEEVGIYLGARGIKFNIFPGSPLRKKAPAWLVAAELTETTRLYARTVASIEAQWLERVGAHLIKRTYHDPHWEKAGQQAYAFERLTLYGLVVVSRRKIAYGPVDPALAREIFIREGLVHAQLATQGRFLTHNEDLKAQIQDLEHKSRRHDVLVDDERIFAFYDALVPREVWSGQQFERWRREAERANAKLLFLTREQMMRHAAEDITQARFPEALEIGGVAYPLRYKFEPGHPLDGVTMTVALHLLNQVDEQRCEWLVPGLLRDKISHLLKALPKGIRKNFVPVPQYVTALLERLDIGNGALLPALSQALKRETGVDVPLEAWDTRDLPAYLSMNFEVVDDAGKELAMGRDLAQLRATLGVKARKQFSESARNSFERKGLTAWDFGELPEQVEFERGGQRLIGYPAIVDEGGSVALQLLDTEHDAEVAMHRGLRRLFQLAAPEQVKFVARSLPNFQEMTLRYALLLELEGGKAGDKGAISERLRHEVTDAVCDRAFFVESEPIRTAAAFQARVAKAKTRLMDVANEVCRVMNDILGEYQTLRPRINQQGVAVWQRAMNDVRGQLKQLLPPAFVVGTPLPRLQQFPRYLRAMHMRLDKFALNPAKDAQWMQQLQNWWQAYQGRLAATRASGVYDARLEEFRWMLEELRVSLWAQQLKTPYPVSFKRLEKAWNDLG